MMDNPSPPAFWDWRRPVVKLPMVEDPPGPSLKYAARRRRHDAGANAGRADVGQFPESVSRHLWTRSVSTLAARVSLDGLVSGLPSSAVWSTCAL